MVFDKVKIRDDIEIGKEYGGLQATGDIDQFFGERTEIKEVLGNNRYRLKVDEGENIWSGSMLEHLVSEKYDRLRVAVQDFLLELRITPGDLEKMANGLSPDMCHDFQDFHSNRIQISQNVAKKLCDAGMLIIGGIE